MAFPLHYPEHFCLTYLIIPDPQRRVLGDRWSLTVNVMHISKLISWLCAPEGQSKTQALSSFRGLYFNSLYFSFPEREYKIVIWHINLCHWRATSLKDQGEEGMKSGIEESSTRAESRETESRAGNTEGLFLSVKMLYTVHGNILFTSLAALTLFVINSLHWAGLLIDIVLRLLPLPLGAQKYCFCPKLSQQRKLLWN